MATTGGDMASAFYDLASVDLVSHKTPCSYENVNCGTTECYTCYVGVTPNFCVQLCSLSSPSCPSGQTCRPLRNAPVGGFGGSCTATSGDGYCL